MTNFFAGIYRANDALTTARYGLEVTSQNIANANTPGYTRQRADQVSIGAAVGVPTLHSGTVDNGGVRSLGASRLGDAVLDARTRAEHARSASVDVTASRFADIENIFREPSDTGLAEQLHDYWNAWGDVANDPGGQVPREMLIASAQSTVTMLRSKNSALDDVATAARNSLDALVTRANTAAGELSELNRQISIGEATGANINSLLDQRDLLLDDLSRTVGGVATLHENGTASVKVGNADLVSVGAGGRPPFAANTIGAAVVETDPVTVAVNFTVGLTAVTVSDSAAAAEAKTLSETVPGYRAKLDDVARALARTVNDLQAGASGPPPIPPGYDLDGNVGAAMFADGSGAGASIDPDDITAANISVANGFSWDKVAASSAALPAGNLDASNALKASLTGADPTGPDAAYSSLVGDLGRASASAKQQQATQAVVTGSVDALKATQSGVSFDEEVSNMLVYQMAFQASSRVLTTLDDMLDTLINRTGLVGR